MFAFNRYQISSKSDLEGGRGEGGMNNELKLQEIACQFEFRTMYLTILKETGVNFYVADPSI